MLPTPSVRRVLSLSLVLTLVPALAGAFDPPKQRNRQRGGDAGTQASAKAGAKASDLQLPQPSAAQQANLQKLRQDLGTIGQGVKGADDEIRHLTQDLQGMAVHPPDPALVEDLAADLSAALADSSLSPQEMAQLTQSIYGVLNSAGLDAQEVATLKDDVEDALTASGVGKAEVQAVVADLQAIADAAQGKSPSGGRTARKRVRG